MAISFISDICWAYAMLLTSPLVVTVGLNLTIPLSLVGQVILNAQIPSLIYWIGAGIVFLAFVLVNHESKKEEEDAIIISSRQDHVHGQDAEDGESPNLFR
jgi:solute carrier family 35, member F5